MKIVSLNQVPCKHSRGTQCALVNQKVGVSVGIAKKACDQCLEWGVDSDQSATLREKAVDMALVALSDPSIKLKMQGLDGWQKTHLSWKAAGEWIKSKASRVLGPVPLPILQTRRESCFGRVGSEACPMLRKHTDGFHYCASCGCGVREDARLDGDPSKLEFPYLKCPLGRPGFSNTPLPSRLPGPVSESAGTPPA